MPLSYYSGPLSAAIPVSVPTDAVLPAQCKRNNAPALRTNTLGLAHRQYKTQYFIYDLVNETATSSDTTACKMYGG